MHRLLWIKCKFLGILPASTMSMPTCVVSREQIQCTFAYSSIAICSFNFQKICTAHVFIKDILQVPTRYGRPRKVTALSLKLFDSRIQVCYHFR